ncbi:MAG: sensor histidine kinase [Candidatus Cryptobacteroides sp.]
MKRLPLYIDMAFCLVLLPLMIFFFPVERWWFTRPLLFVTFLVWLYISYFAYRYLIMPFILRKGKYLWYALGLASVSLSITCFLSRMIEISSPFHQVIVESGVEPEYMVWGMRPTKQAIWLYYIIVVIFCSAIDLLDEMYRQKLAREEMELERNKAELALYHAQINPHFLFNTLNTLYGLVLTGSDKAVSAMERFIDLTKYIYVSAKEDYIPLHDEVNYIEQYIELQKLRLNEFAHISCKCEMDSPESPIPPLLLITFVENAFKWGISSCENCFVDLSLCQNGGKLHFLLLNSIVKKEQKSSGSGIENCRKRLELLYPQRHRLTCGREDKVYKVDLEIEL